MPNNIKDFVNKWAGRGNEKQQTQQFWNGLIFNVLAAPPDTDIQYENTSMKKIDQQLYKKYDLTDEEIEFVETHVKEME